MFSFFSRIAASLAIAAMLMPIAALWQGAAAQEPNLSLIRDAEIENTLRAYATPVFKVAGLDPSAVHIYIVNDPSINAFVAGGQRLFVFTGLLMKATSAGQVIGVIAHETGHIAGGHLARMQEQLSNASVEMILEMLLSAAAAGVAIGSGGGVSGGAPGGPPVGLTQRALFSYTRTQEASADQAALTFLDRMHQSARGLLTFSEMLMQRELVSGANPDPYLLTHPLTQERVTYIEHHVETSPYSNVPVPAHLELLQRRMVAKLYGFIAPQQALGRYPESDRSLPARYARSIAYYRTGRIGQALQILDGLIKENPRDPYFHELRGQILFENQRVAESIPSYEQAVALLPNSSLLKIGLAQSLIETNDPARIAQATKALESVEEEERTPNYWRLMSIVYDRAGNIGMRSLALAERAYAMGSRGDAKQFADRAMRELPYGTPGWQRAQDIQFLADKKRP